MPTFKPTSGLTSKGVRRVAETDPTAMGVQRFDARESGLTSEGMNRIATTDVEAAKLSTQQRKSLPDTEFIFPDKAPGPGSCPIPDAAHGEKALQICRGDKDVIHRKVCSKFPSLPACEGD